MDIQRGYLYVATGEKYIEEALTSLRSLRKVTKSVHATLVTDEPIELPEFDMIKIVQLDNPNPEEWKSGILYKVLALQNSPYQETFFVDTDTYFCASCEELFRLLNYYDLLICHAPSDVSVVKVNNQYLEGYYPYNTGVIVYNKTAKIEKLFEDWLKMYQLKFKDYPHDQPAFMDALLFNPIKIYVLLPIYNFRTPHFVTLPPKNVKILHGRPKNFEALAQKINPVLEHGTWHPQKQTIFTRKATLKQKIYNRTPKFILDLYRFIRK